MYIKLTILFISFGFVSELCFQFPLAFQSGMAEKREETNKAQLSMSESFQDLENAFQGYMDLFDSVSNGIEDAKQKLFVYRIETLIL